MFHISKSVKRYGALKSYYITLNDGNIILVTTQKTGEFGING